MSKREFPADIMAKAAVICLEIRHGNYGEHRLCEALMEEREKSVNFGVSVTNGNQVTPRG